MTLLQIYFIIAASILLSKFLFGICTFKYLKLFVSENKTLINDLIYKNSLTYSDLIIYHFSTLSVKYEDYSDKMNEFLIDGSCFEIILYILFALFWIISVPCVLLCMLFGWLETAFEKFYCHACESDYWNFIWEIKRGKQKHFDKVYE